MEDFLNFVVYYSPLVFGKLLVGWNMDMEDAWNHLRRAVLHYARGTSTADVTTPDAQVQQARAAAKQHLWDHARIMETKGPRKMLTFNMRLAVVHLFRQEQYLGVVGAAMEMWVERAIQRVKGIVKEGRVKNKPVEAIVNVMCEKWALEEYLFMHPDTRDLHTLAETCFKSAGPAQPLGGMLRDPAAEAATAPCFFLGSGRRLSPNAPCLNRIRPAMESLVTPLRDAGQLGSDITVYLRMSLNTEVFTSSQYTRAEKRVSYYVSICDVGLRDLPSGICLPEGRPYAKVLAYYLVSEPASGRVVCRLARIEAYKEVEDAYLMKHGITVVDKTDVVELLLPCAYIGTKAIFFEPTGDATHYHVVHLVREIRTGVY